MKDVKRGKRKKEMSDRRRKLSVREERTLEYYRHVGIKNQHRNVNQGVEDGV